MDLTQVFKQYDRSTLATAVASNKNIKVLIVREKKFGYNFPGLHFMLIKFSQACFICRKSDIDYLEKF